MTRQTSWAASGVFPLIWLADPAVRQHTVPNALRNTVEKNEDFPRGRPFRIGNIRYGAFIVPADLTRFTYRSHPLDGRIVDEAGIDQLVADLAAAAGDINGSWAVTAFGDVIFEGEEQQ